MEISERPQTRTADEWDTWRTSLRAAMLESFVAHACEQHQGLSHLVQVLSANVNADTSYQTSGWLVAAGTFGRDVIRVIAAQHSAETQTKKHTPSIWVELEPGCKTDTLHTKVSQFFGGTSMWPDTSSTLSTMKRAGTSLLVVDGLDHLAFENERNAPDVLKHLASHVTLVCIRSHESDRHTNPQRHASVSMLGMWMKKVDLRSLQAGQFDQF